MFPMSTSVRTAARGATYHHGDLRNVLLASARELAAEGSIDGFRLREVARRAGVSHSAAYNHFADKAALVEALATEAFETLAAAMNAASEFASEPATRLANAGVAYVCFAVTHPAEFRFMFRPEHCAREGAAESTEALRRASNESYGILRDAVRTALHAGAIAGDEETLVLCAWSTVHGLATLLVDGPQHYRELPLAAVESLARAVTTTLLAGFATRP
jgi:AcrR family transcriptional regulator